MMWHRIAMTITLGLTLTQSFAADNLTLSQSVNDPVAFVSHQDTTTDYWLGENVNYKPVADLFAQLGQHVPGEALHNRGDAHITVITPPEYLILKPYLSPSQVDQIAQQGHIQQAKFQIICLGRGQALDQYGQLMKTYFLVAKSPDLIRIRRKLFEQYVANGGMPSHFDPDHFTPHITVGFTDRDLFEQDGVYKQHNACFLPVKMVPA